MSGLVSLGLPDICRDIFAQARSEALAAKRPPSPDASEIPYAPDPFMQGLKVGGEISPRDIIAYQSEAQQGNPRNLYEVYHRLPGFGPGPQLQKMVLAMQGAEHHVRAWPAAYQDEDVKKPEARVAREIATGFSEQMRPLWAKYEEIQARKRLFGISAGILSVEPGASDMGLEQILDIEEVQPEHFRLDRPTRRWIYMPDPKRREGLFVDELQATGAFLFFEMEKNRPLTSRGLGWQLLVVACAHQFGYRWWVRFLELLGIPPRLIKYDRSIPKEKELAQAIGQRAGAAGFAAIPKEMDFVYAQLTSAGARGDFEAFIEYGERWFDKVILGHAQSTGVQVGGGSVQSTQEAQKWADRLTNARLSDGDSDLTDMVARPYVARNHGDDTAKRNTPRIESKVCEPFDRKQEAEVIVGLSKSGAGQGMAVADVLGKFGYRVAKPGEATLGKPAPETLPGQAGEKLARVIGGPERFAAGITAPDGIGEEIVGPYREIFARALAEDVTVGQALMRVITRANGRPEAPILHDRLASVLLGRSMQGVVDVRGERS